jgi:hypothetical protein
MNRPWRRCSPGWKRCNDHITYFTRGISWSADYIGIAAPDESHMNLESFVRVSTNSGEEYEDAQARETWGHVPEKRGAVRN